jgi:catechol 2,3-dioxygenase-like lactoylglutathione lyase family enzyme
MSSTEVRNELSAISPDAVPVNMKLEVVVVPVSDVGRAKRFYQSLG